MRMLHCINVYAYINVYTCINVSTRHANTRVSCTHKLSVYRYINVCLYVYVFYQKIYIYIYIYTHTHTHTHTFHSGRTYDGHILHFVNPVKPPLPRLPHAFRFLYTLTRTNLSPSRRISETAKWSKMCLTTGPQEDLFDQLTGITKKTPEGHPVPKGGWVAGGLTTWIPYYASWSNRALVLRSGDPPCRGE
jgi:hypothetical protein